MPSLKAFREMAGLPAGVRRWKQAAEHVRTTAMAAQNAENEVRIMKAERARERVEAPDTHESGGGDMFNLNVDWRAVSYNEPSRNMPRSVPWVHGLIRDAAGPSPRIELAPKRQTNDDAPIQLVLAHPGTAAEAEAMDWDATLDITVDGHTVGVQKSMGPAYGWCEPEPYALVVEVQADHPLVVHAAEAAKGPKEAMDKATDDFYARARDWVDANFPHPDIMNVVRSLMLSEWQMKEGYWPGDPLPDFDTIMTMARDQLRG